jgi:TldD protein
MSLSYSTGAFGGLRTFKFLENELMKKCTDMAKRTVEFSKAKASYKNFKLTSGSYKAVLDGRVAGVSLHEYGAGHLAEAHRILKSGEALVFEGKLGKQVAPEEITLIDDSKFEICGIKPTSFYIFDVEGVEKVPTEIIKNGIFNSYLHSKLTAGTLPEDRGGGKLTGNARVETEAETNEEENKIPCPRMSTLYLKPGNYKFEELLEEAKGGLYISSGSPSGGVATELGIGYVNIDEIYFIDKDKELIPLRVPGTSISLTGNAISFMKKIKMVGDKSTISLDAGYCGAESGWVPQTIFAPALLVRDIELEITRLEQPLKKPLLEI